MKNVITDITRLDLVDLIREAKNDGIERSNADFASSSFQICAYDKDGERISGSPIAEARRNQTIPPMRDLKEVFVNYPDAVYITVEGHTMWLGDWGNAATQREEATVADWWELEIYREPEL